MDPGDSDDSESYSDEPTAETVSLVVDALIRQDARWKRGKARRFGELTWTPELTATKALMHVHLAKRLRPYVIERMKAAREMGLRVHIAMPLDALYDEKLLTQLADLNVSIHLVEGKRVQKPDLLLSCINGRIQVTSETRRTLGIAGWELCLRATTAAEKGASLEALLAFLLGQIADFSVVERNLRTETEELDIVVAQRATTGRCWAVIGTPFILVEAKNWSNKVGQAEVSTLITKMRGKRGTVRISLLVARNGFSEDAMKQELRFASDDKTIVLIGPDEISEWIAASDGDEALESVVRRAMLR